MPSYRLSGERLTRVAAAKGDHSGYAIAKRTGLSQTTISRLRRGIAKPATGSLLALAAAYEVAIEELVDTYVNGQTETSEAAGGATPTASDEHDQSASTQIGTNS